jgi:hypothetical protein
MSRDPVLNKSAGSVYPVDPRTININQQVTGGPMRSLRPSTVLMLGAALTVAAACAQSGDQEAAAAENVAAETAVPEVAPQEIACYLARGTVEEAAERPSPLGQTTFTLGGQEAKLCYGRPSARGRTVFGELEAFGAPWRSGANEATAIHLPFAADIGGVALDPGSYSLYTVPGEEEWEVVLNGTAERWGIPISEEVRAADIGSFMRPAEATEDLVETLTYRWEPQGADAGELILEWEHTRIRIPVRSAGS